MMLRETTAQETFWAGQFGNEYTTRNNVMIDDRIEFFTKILEKAPAVASVCELGANKGHNLDTIHTIDPTISLTGVEINPSAYSELSQKTHISPVNTPIQNFKPNKPFDLIYTCGVLIHINPSDLPQVYQLMFENSARYILINEYYNSTPVALNYRGHSEKLFKRDFAGELMEQYPGQVKLVDYGFLWERCNPTWDDMTWFLLEKVSQ